MINNYVKKMNKEYVGNMNKLIELIARGENLDVNKLKTKYLGVFKSNPDTEDTEDINIENQTPTETTDTPDAIISTNIINTNIDEVYLDKISIANSEYWYEKKDNGNIYYNNVVVGNYDKSNNIFEINGKKYNTKLQMINI
jgi:hypothetical protein